MSIADDWQAWLSEARVRIGPPALYHIEYKQHREETRPMATTRDFIESECVYPIEYKQPQEETRPMATTRDFIESECDTIKALLIMKNEAYGDSAMRPVRIFSKASPIEQILVRIDDKLSRLARGSAAGEDVTMDLIGYLVLLRIAERAAKPAIGER